MNRLKEIGEVTTRSSVELLYVVIPKYKVIRRINKGDDRLHMEPRCLSSIILGQYVDCFISTGGNIYYCNISKTKLVTHTALNARFIIVSSKSQCIRAFWFHRVTGLS